MMVLKFIRLCFALLVFFVEVQSCNDPCGKYPKNSCSLIKSMNNSIIGVSLTSPKEQNGLLLSAHKPCEYRTAWTIVATNIHQEINIIGVFEPLWFQQIYITLVNVSNLNIAPRIFQHVTVIMFIELRANSTIQFQNEAFIRCRGIITVSQPGNERVGFNITSFKDSVFHVQYLRSGEVIEFWDGMKLNQLLPPLYYPSSGYCETLTNAKEKAILTDYELESRILPYITLGLVILVLAFCIAITVSICLNGRSSGKYTPSAVKFTKKAKEPRNVTGNNLNVQTAGLPSMSKSPLLPPRNPATERNLPRPPIPTVNSSSR